MTFPQLSKNWTISPNVRQAFTTLVGVAGWYAYENKTRMLAVGWTVKFTSDGATGPTDDLDTTDRITSAANFATRATVAAAAQSWYVLQNVDGIQILFTYQGASDDIMRISYSPGGLFTLAGTTTHQPTASDEVIITAATTVIDPSTSLDRIMSIFCANDSTAWRSVVFRNSSVVSCLSCDKVTRIGPTTTLPVPYVAGKFTDLSRTLTSSNAGLTPVHNCGALSAIGTSGSRGFFGSVFTSGVTRVCRMFGITALGQGTSGFSSTAQMSDASQLASTFCASMGGSGALCWPIIVWGEDTANLDGPWASLIDWSQMVTAATNNPATGNFVPGLDVGDNPISDPARTNWFVALGAAAIWPWKNAAPTMEMV